MVVKYSIFISVEHGIESLESPTLMHELMGSGDELQRVPRVWKHHREIYNKLRRVLAVSLCKSPGGGRGVWLV